MTRVKGITQFYLTPSRLSTNGISNPAFTPSHKALPHFGRFSSSVPLRVGGWVGLGCWLHRTEVVCPPEDGHPSQYQPTDSAGAGDTTHDHWVPPWDCKMSRLESQVRRPNHQTTEPPAKNDLRNLKRKRQVKTSMSVLLRLLFGRNVRWPRRMLPPGESRWVCRRDRQTDGLTPDRYYYAFR